jgi:hypothetical protein
MCVQCTAAESSACRDALAFGTASVFGNATGIQVDGGHCGWQFSDIGPVVLVGTGNLNLDPRFIAPAQKQLSPPGFVTAAGRRRSDRDCRGRHRRRRPTSGRRPRRGDRRDQVMQQRLIRHRVGAAVLALAGAVTPVTAQGAPSRKPSGPPGATRERQIRSLTRADDGSDVEQLHRAIGCCGGFVGWTGEL